MKKGQIIDIKELQNKDVVWEMSRMAIGHELSFCLTRTRSGDNTKLYRIRKINDTQVEVIRVYRADI